MDAEVARDEFGGYCCKRWSKLNEESDDDICGLLGFNVEQKALEIVKSDFEKRKRMSSPKKVLVQ